MPGEIGERAPAKVNLTLRVIRRRPDGYHDIESLVVFAADGVSDTLALTPAPTLSLSVQGSTADAAGAIDDNLVLKAARALAARVDGLEVGRFVLSKHLPVAAGLGGGSADAAAALRLLVRANQMALNGPRVMEAARVTGADVPVCLDPRPRIMRGTGDVLSAPIHIPPLRAILVNPGVAVPTKDVFAAYHRHAGVRSEPGAHSVAGAEGQTDVWKNDTPDAGRELPSFFEARAAGSQLGMAEAVQLLVEGGNDLEAPAISIQPVIADVLDALRALPGCRLARMSGSGATCFALFDTAGAAMAGAGAIREAHPGWWVRATTLG